MQKHTKFLIVITGPTAVGKTTLSIELAKKYSTEIISADSRQFYKETNKGTAKPSLIEQEGIVHHFIDSHSIHQEFNVGQYEEQVIKTLDILFQKYTIVILVGGSGLYVKAVLEGIDDMPLVKEHVREDLNSTLKVNGLNPLLEELKSLDPYYYHTVDKKNPQRIIRALEVIRSTGLPFSNFHSTMKKARKFQPIKIGLELPREILYQKINKRMQEMIEEGLMEEARALFQYKNLNALQTVGYKEVFEYMEGKYTYEEMVDMLKQNTRRYAKRQLTWFKKDQEIKWFNPLEFETIVAYIQEKLLLNKD